MRSSESSSIRFGVHFWLTARFAVDSQKGFENVLVLDNVPIVDEGKREKLIVRLRQLFSKAGAGIDEDRMNMPWDDEAKTSKGFIFLSYPTPQEAENALQALNGASFGKNTLYVNRFGDIERYANLSVGDDELPPGWKERAFTEKPHARNWLGDAAGRDQYLTFRDNTVSMWWNGRNGNAEQVIKVEDGKPLTSQAWGQYYVQWSPLGTYLTTVHVPGVALWSGPDLNPPHRLTHPSVRLVQFSPCEKYLVTWSPEPLNFGSYDEKIERAVRETFGPEDDGAQFVIWEVKTGRMLRTFPGEKPDENGQPRQSKWPVFKWSPDDAYVARCVVGHAIQVYELPHMGLLDKKSVKAEGVADFEWCPMGDKDFEDRKNGKGRECMIAYWTPEAPNQPARVNLMGLPSRNVLRSKNLFNVTDCKFAFQNQGDFLCVKVDRHARKAKNKKATFCNLEIFRLREKDFPVEVIEHKEYVTSFAWEPAGTRFAMVSTADPNFGQNIPGAIIKYNVSFYEPDPKKGDFTPFKVLEGKVVNTLMWSPRGRNIVLASVGSPTKCDIEFWDVDFATDDSVNAAGAKKERDPEERANAVQLLNTGEHYGITDIAWDPSGRYLGSWASSWNSTPEPGFMIWDFKGQQLVHQGLEKFKQFLWRPRPASLLSKADRRKIRKELKDYARVFEDEDMAEENRGSAEKLAQRQREIAEWDAWRQRNNQRIAAARKARGEVLPSHKDEGAAEEVSEIFEELIDETEEVVVS